MRGPGPAVAGHRTSKPNRCVKSNRGSDRRASRPCNDVAVPPAPRPAGSPHTPRPGAGAAAADGEAQEDSDPGGRGRLLVVSHPAVVSVNQEVYRELRSRGWDVTIVLPRRWRSEYSGASMRAARAAGDGGRAASDARGARAAAPSATSTSHAAGRCSSARVPTSRFSRLEPFALAASQWGARAVGSRRALRRAVLREHRPPPAASRCDALRARVLRDAAFVAARSETAGELARAWGATGEIALAPPAVPAWERVPARSERPFTVGYAGRLVKSKGVMDLLGAVRMLDGAGRAAADRRRRAAHRARGQARSPARTCACSSGLGHDEMAGAYAQIDVLVLPSHTTLTWKEQFGRVIVEALWCGVPVVGSDSGEIPWLIELTGGGLVFAEGDRALLARALARLRDEPAAARRARSGGTSDGRAPVLGGRRHRRARAPARGRAPRGRGCARERVTRLMYRRSCLSTISAQLKPSAERAGRLAEPAAQTRVAASSRQPRGDRRAGLASIRNPFSPVADQLAHAAHRRRQQRQAAGWRPRR